MSAHSKHFVTSEGARTAYWEYRGSDRQRESDLTVVMVHGFRGDHHGLELLAASLGGARVIVPDLPGFGESSPLHEPHTIDAFARWLIGFTEQTAPGQFVIVGHSFGSLVVTAAIAGGLAPSGVVLINPISSPALQGPRAILTRGAVLYYQLGSLLPEPLANALLRSRLIVRVMSETMAKTTDRAQRRWIHNQHHQFFSTFTNRRSLLDAFRASVSHTTFDFASALTAPTLLIVGEKDDITQLTEQLKLSRRLTDARLHIIPDVGHLIHYEAADEAVAVMHQFMAEQFEKGPALKVNE